MEAATGANASCAPSVANSQCQQRSPIIQKLRRNGVNLVVSAAVYSTVETVRALLHSIHAFVGCDTVLHLNNMSSITPLEVRALIEDVRYDERFHLNPIRLPMATSHYASPFSLLDIHLCNFRLARGRFGSMTHILFMGEDERFVRPGILDYLRNDADAGISHIPRMGCSSCSETPAKITCASPSERAGCCPHDVHLTGTRGTLPRDPLLEILSENHSRSYYGQIEGSFFRREVLMDVEDAYEQASRSVDEETRSRYKSLGPQELYVPTIVMRLPCVRVIPAVTYVNWQSFHPCKLCVEVKDVHDVARGKYVGRFAVKMGAVSPAPLNHAFERLATMFLKSTRDTAAYTAWIEAHSTQARAPPQPSRYSAAPLSHDSGRDIGMTSRIASLHRDLQAIKRHLGLLPPPPPPPPPPVLLPPPPPPPPSVPTQLPLKAAKKQAKKQKRLESGGRR